MAGVVVFILVICFLVFVLPAAFRAQSRISRRNRAYHQIATQYGGEAYSGGIFRGPRVRFRYGTSTVWLRSGRRRHAGWIEELEIQWPDAHVQMCIHNRYQRWLKPSWQRMAELDTRTTVLGSELRVRYKEREAAEKLLSDGVCWQARQLYEFLQRSCLLIAIKRGSLTIRKYTRIRKFHDLDQFVRIGLAWFDQALLTQSEGIEFVADDQAQILDEITCKVCGDGIVLDMVFCARCRTPHHHDCWLYTGRCSVYGCQETRFTVPMVATPTSDKNKDVDATTDTP